MDGGRSDQLAKIGGENWREGKSTARVSHVCVQFYTVVATYLRPSRPSPHKGVLLHRHLAPAGSCWLVPAPTRSISSFSSLPGHNSSRCSWDRTKFVHNTVELIKKKIKQGGVKGAVISTNKINSIRTKRFS